MREINKKASITHASPRDMQRLCQNQNFACQNLKETTVLGKKSTEEPGKWESEIFSCVLVAFYFAVDRQQLYIA